MGKESERLLSAAATPGQRPQRRDAHATLHTNRYSLLADVHEASDDDSVKSGPVAGPSSHMAPPSGPATEGASADATARSSAPLATAYVRTSISSQSRTGTNMLIPSQLTSYASVETRAPRLADATAPRFGSGTQRSFMDTVAPDANARMMARNVRAEHGATSDGSALPERGRRRSSGAAPQRDHSKSRSASRLERPFAEPTRSAPGPPSRAAAASSALGSDSRRRGISRAPGPETRPAPHGGKRRGGIRFDAETEENPSKRGVFEDFVKERLQSERKARGGMSNPAPAPVASSLSAAPAPRGGILRAGSKWAAGSRPASLAFRLPEGRHVNSAFSPRLGEFSHDIALYFDVPAGVSNPLKMATGTSRAAQRIAYHHLSSVFLETYHHTLAPTFAAQAAAALNSSLAAASGGGDAGAYPANRDNLASLLPTPQDLLFYPLASDNVIAVILRLRNMDEATQVHAALMTSMPSGFSFANAGASRPCLHSSSRKVVASTDGAPPCFTTLDVVGMPPRGADPACDKLHDKLLSLAPFAGNFRATVDSAIIEVTVSPVTFVESHLIPAFGAGSVDCSKDSILVKLGDTAPIEIVVLQSTSKAACARCQSACHRVKFCSRNVLDRERKAKEKAERERHAAAAADRQRKDDIALLNAKSMSAVDDFLAATRVSNTVLLESIRSKVMTLIDVSDAAAVTAGLAEASGQDTAFAVPFGSVLACMAGKRASLRAIAVLPVSAGIAGAGLPSPAAESSPPAQQQPKRSRTETCAVAVPTALVADVTMTPARAPSGMAPPPGLATPGTPVLSGGIAAAFSTATSYASTNSSTAFGVTSIFMTALDDVLASAYESDDAYRSAATKAVVSDICSVTNAFIGENADNLPQYFNSHQAVTVRLATTFENPSRSTLDGSDSAHMWKPSLAAITSAIGPVPTDLSCHHYGLFLPKLRDVCGVARPARFSLSRLSGALFGIVARALPALHRSPAWSEAFIYAMPPPALPGPHSPGTRTTSLPPNSGAEGGAR